MAKQLRVTIKGRVQGVGFRFAVVNEAQRLGLTGWVRNTRRGDVEALLEGEEPELHQMRAWCGRGPALARVQEVDEEWSDAPRQHETFEVRYGG